MTYTPPKKRHWEKFNFQEWMTDPALCSCSRAARSLWLDMCGLIYAANDRGRLIIDGKNPDHLALAHRLGDHGSTTRALLAELELKKVFVRDDEGFVVSKRILREFLKAQKDYENGKLGGNPDLISKDKQIVGVNTHSHSQSHIDKYAAAKGVILSVTGPGMIHPDHNPAVIKSLDRMLDAWLGLYDLHLDIVPVVQTRTAKPSRSGKKIRSFDYLDQAIAEHHAGRISGLFAIQPPPQPQKSVKTDTGKSALIALPTGGARVAAHAILTECGEPHYRARFGNAEWNGKTVKVDQWNLHKVDSVALAILAEEGFELVARE